MERTPQADKELPAVAGPRLFVSIHPSHSLICLSSSLPTSSRACAHTRTHTHKPKPPDRKYRLGSQRGFLIQTSPLEQPEVAAPTPLPLLLSFPLSLSLSLSCFFFSASLSFIHLPPHVLATRAHTDTPRLHTRATHPPPKRFRPAYQRFLRYFADLEDVCVCVE